MGRTRKLVAAAAAVGVPVLAFASPASAAQAADDATLGVTFRNQNGTGTPCTLTASHEVDTDTGRLAVQFSAGHLACRGTIAIAVDYLDDDGDAAHADTIARQSMDQGLTLHDAGSTLVTVDYTISFDGCAVQCTSHTLQTTTK